MVDKTFSYKLKGVMIYINKCNYKLFLMPSSLKTCILRLLSLCYRLFTRGSFLMNLYFSGCYQRTPLFICLCGVDEEQQTVRPRNLFLARLLVENGANVNYRVPMVIGTLVQCFVLFHNCAVHTAYFSVALIFPMDRKRYNEFS